MLIVSIIVFLIVHLTPGNTAYLILGEDSSQESIEQVEIQLGLDKPLVIQVFSGLGNVLTGDLGQSVYSSEPVAQIIIDHLGPTFSLMVIALVLTLLIAIPTAIFVVWKRNTVLDPTFISISILGVSITEFWFAILLVLCFVVAIHIFQVAGYIPFAEGALNWFYHLILPAFVLAARSEEHTSELQSRGHL